MSKSQVTPRSLARYQQKRDFTQTAEPSGRLAVSPSRQLRFVIQKHAASHLHYDLRLELDGVFKSWAVTRGPSIDPSDKRLAVEVEDHPLDYGDFEGTIPKGQYGGGTVQLWDRGYWTPAGTKSPEEGLKAGDLKFTLQGKRLHGSWVLVRIKNDRSGNKRTNWLLIKHRDEFAKPGEAQALLDSDRSVASGRSMNQITAGKGKAPNPFMLANDSVKSDAVWRSNREDKTQSVLQPSSRAKGATTATLSPRAQPPTLKSMPTFIELQLCKLVDRPPAASGWAHEVKFDGYRAQLRVQGTKARIRTRGGLDWTEQFAAIAEQANGLPDCIIDGEICALDKDLVLQRYRPRCRKISPRIWCCLRSTCWWRGKRTCARCHWPIERVGWSSCFRRQTEGIRFVMWRTSNQPLTRCCSPPARCNWRASCRSDWMRRTPPVGRAVGRRPSAGPGMKWCWAVGPARREAFARCWRVSIARVIWCMWAASVPATAPPLQPNYCRLSRN